MHTLSTFRGTVRGRGIPCERNCGYAGNSDRTWLLCCYILLIMYRSSEHYVTVACFSLKSRYYLVVMVRSIVVTLAAKYVTNEMFLWAENSNPLIIMNLNVSKLFSSYQINAHFLYSITIYMLHCNPQHVSSSTMLIFRRTNCIITASDIITLCNQPYSMPLSTGVLYGCLQRVTIPEAVVIQFVLLKMSMVLLETC